MINEYPEKKCPICGSDSWWYRMEEPWQTTKPAEPNEWLCCRCHPSPDPLVQLKYRVVKGNFKLNKALQRIIYMEDETRKQVLPNYHDAVAKLKALKDELKMKGATECLYIEKGKKLQSCLSDPKFQCTVCPNDYWWEKELMELDRKDHPEVYADENS